MPGASDSPHSNTSHGDTPHHDTPHHDERTDRALLDAHIHGDTTAFSALVHRHHGYLWTLALRTTNNADDAADALQDALLAAHRTAHTFRGEAKVTSWLHRIVVNSALDRLRRNAARRTVPLLEPDALTRSTTDDYGQVDLVLAITDALAELPAHQRAAVVALDMEGYSVSEAAQLLGVPEGTIKSRSSRGRVRLATLLGYLRGDDA